MFVNRSLVMAIVMCFSMQSAQAIMMTGEGIQTNDGLFISWVQLANLSSEVKQLRAICAIEAVLFTVALAYVYWSKDCKD